MNSKTKVLLVLMAVSEITMHAAESLLQKSVMPRDGRGALEQDLAHPEMPGELLSISLPENIYAVKGRPIQIFFRGCVDAVNYLNYDNLVNCAIGNKFNRYYEAKPDTCGVYPFTLWVRGNSGNILGRKTCSLTVVPEPAAPKANKNILCVGASATDTAHWPAELKRMLTGSGGTPGGLALPNLTFVGRKSKTVSAGQVNYEATGGWTWSTYIHHGVKSIRFDIENASSIQIDDAYSYEDPTGAVSHFSIAEINTIQGKGNIRCIYRYGTPSKATPTQHSGKLLRIKGAGSTPLLFTGFSEENFAPFYQNNKLDFRKYADTYCGGKIDILITHMGINSVLWEDSNVSNVIADARKFLDAFFESFPNSQVILSAIPVPSQDGGMGCLYTTANTINQYGALLKFQEYNRALEGLTKEKPYGGKVFFAASNSQFDSENGFPKVSKPVNSRMPEAEIIGANPTHPNEIGSYMVADSIFRTLSFCLNLEKAGR